MYFDFSFVNEDCRAWASLYDTWTNKNWEAEFQGTVCEIAQAWARCEELLVAAGYILGREMTASAGGPVPYQVLVREAANRCSITFYRSFKF